VKCKTGHGKSEEKVNLGVLGVDSQDLKGVPQSHLDPTLKTDILKMDQAFQMGYKERDKVFYLFFTNWKGKSIPLMNMNPHGIFIGGRRMGDLNPS
jgi:hypothetical protein